VETHVRSAWGGIRVIDMVEKGPQEVPVDTPLTVHATLALGSLSPNDVGVSCTSGILKADRSC